MNPRFLKNLAAFSLFSLALAGVSGCHSSTDSASSAPLATNPKGAGFRTIAATVDANAPAWGTSPEQGMVPHAFVYKADKKIEGVRLVGSFNKWDKNANPMKADADGLTWRVNLPLPPGRYDYKFVPFAPTEQAWIPDPNAPLDDTDKVHQNSLLLLLDEPFVYHSEQKLERVSLVGSFNNWDKTASRMVKGADGQTWKLRLPLSPGRYQYKFAPFSPQEGTWVSDPNAPKDETDKLHDNSLLVVKAPDDGAKGAKNEEANAPAAKAGEVVHSFVYKADHALKSVALVGSFNSWNKTANPMRADADGLTWRLDLPLAPGRYVYKFAGFETAGGEKWVPDPNAPLDETDKVNQNSLLIVTPVGYEKPASPDDGITATGALQHRNGMRDMSYDEGRIALSLRTRPNDLSQVWLKSSNQRYPMKMVSSEEFYATYVTDVPWNRQSDLVYDFELKDGSRIEEFGADGVGAHPKPFRIAAKTFRPYLLSDPTRPLKMNGPLTTQSVAGPAWAKNQPIYEVNLDVYKFPQGTALREYEKQLPVLKAMGIGMVWFMPLHPRGHLHGYGSPYSVQDYTDINPDFGSKEDFKHLVSRAHELGMHVLMDWVPNHTAWENPLLESHPEFYAKDGAGKIQQVGDYADVAQLDYGHAGAWNKPLWNTMRDDMVSWVRDYGVDGFRCDYAGRAGKVPGEFWTWLRPQLDAVKPVFMLGEADDAYLHPAFDMTYEWTLPPILWDICAGRKDAHAIDEELRREALVYPPGALKMRFIDNHDWHPNADWGWGKGAPVDTHNGLPEVAPLMVLCATLPGKPLLYNGQEMAFTKTDPPAQADARMSSPVYPFYEQLLHLYASQNAVSEGAFAKIPTDHDDAIYAFTRTRGANRVLVAVNLTDKLQTVTLRAAPSGGQLRDWFGNAGAGADFSRPLQLEPWAYRVWVSDAK